MKEITLLPSRMGESPLIATDSHILWDQLIRLFAALREEGDPTFTEFLTAAHWEVPMESWQPPPAISVNDSPCPTEPSREC